MLLFSKDDKGELKAITNALYAFLYQLSTESWNLLKDAMASSHDLLLQRLFNKLQDILLMTAEDPQASEATRTLNTLSECERQGCS